MLKKIPLVMAGIALAAAMLCAGQAMADGRPDAFNTFSGRHLPTKQTSREDAAMLQKLGGTGRSIETDASYRKNWRQELYPCLFGEPSSRHEVLVVLDFSSRHSRTLWEEVRKAAKELDPRDVKIVLFGRSREVYGTDLTGMAIWAARERTGQAMSYLSWALGRWNEIKAGQKQKGRVENFRDGYDAVLTKKDYPMAYQAMTRFKPAVPEKEQFALAKYVYEAGNINLYQANEVCSYYDIPHLPAVVVDGRVYTQIRAEDLVDMLR